MNPDYRRKARHLRHTSNAFLTLAGLIAVLGFAVLFTNLWPGVFIIICATGPVAVSVGFGTEARKFARLGASQSRMNAWNRRNW